jgi:hypothetical protein
VRAAGCAETTQRMSHLSGPSSIPTISGPVPGRIRCRSRDADQEGVLPLALAGRDVPAGPDRTGDGRHLISGMTRLLSRPPRAAARAALPRRGATRGSASDPPGRQKLGPPGLSILARAWRRRPQTARRASPPDILIGRRDACSTTSSREYVFPRDRSPRDRRNHRMFDMGFIATCESLAVPIRPAAIDALLDRCRRG